MFWNNHSFSVIEKVDFVLAFVFRQNKPKQKTKQTSQRGIVDHVKNENIKKYFMLSGVEMTESNYTPRSEKGQEYDSEDLKIVKIEGTEYNMNESNFSSPQVEKFEISKKF
jgi:hypothetical protein